MLTSTFDGASDPHSDSLVDFLLPTGILITLSCKGGKTIAEIKENLWNEARKYPLFSTLRRPEWYVCVFVNRKAEQEECLDEAQRLCDLQMYKALFKVVERKGNEAEKKQSTQISWQIGRQLKEFELCKDPEVTDFRLAMVDQCEKAIQDRANFTWIDKLVYSFPPSVESSMDISSLVEEKLTAQVQRLVCGGTS